jgi:glutathione S-transferase
MKLIIGNKNYSSWSLRPWLLLKAHNMKFGELRIPLNEPDSSELLKKYNPAGKVPALHDGDLIVWDSLAICEYVSEKYLAGKGWPRELNDRAEARAVSAEMHSGFHSLRSQMPMNCRAEKRQVENTPALLNDILRLEQIWGDLRQRHSEIGPWLFGQFTIADCMFAPVAFRFNTYGVTCSTLANLYVKQLLQHPMMHLWREQARAETETIRDGEVGL